MWGGERGQKERGKREINEETLVTPPPPPSTPPKIPFFISLLHGEATYGMNVLSLFLSIYISRFLVTGKNIDTRYADRDCCWVVVVLLPVVLVLLTGGSTTKIVTVVLEC